MKTECNSQMKLNMEVHEVFFWPGGASPTRAALILDNHDDACGKGNLSECDFIIR